MLTPQEEFWAKDFGNAYTLRNRVDWQKRIPFWDAILRQTKPLCALEVGCNAGWNLRAIRAVDPKVIATGVDINEEACREANAAGFIATSVPATEVGILDGLHDLVFTAGLLIHVPPEQLHDVMAAIIAASRRYVLAVEYAADAEEEILYRGHAERLWKRPFGKLYQGLGLKLVAEGEAQGFDRCHFWLMEKP